MKNVRRRILDILKEQGQSTVIDLANALDLAPVSVRHHLDVLLQQGMICGDGVRRSGTRGRPRHVYVLTEAAGSMFPHGYEELARELLREMKRSMPPEQVRAFFQRLAVQSTPRLPMNREQDTEVRLAMATRLLSDKGYLAKWEQNGDDTYLLHVYNCPYEGLPEEHHELCEMDMQLICGLLQRQPERVAHAVAGDHRCTYLISDTKTKPEGEQSKHVEASGDNREI